MTPEIDDVEVKMQKIFTPPLRWFLSECMFEYITESKLSKDLKYKRLIQHPPFCQQFLAYFKKRQKLLFKLWNEQKSTKLFGEMVKCAAQTNDGPDFLKRFVQNISNSVYWAQFIKSITGSGTYFWAHYVLRKLINSVRNVIIPCRNL